MSAENDARGGWWRRLVTWLLGPAREPTAAIEPELPAEVFVRQVKK